MGGIRNRAANRKASVTMPLHGSLVQCIWNPVCGCGCCTSELEKAKRSRTKEAKRWSSFPGRKGCDIWAFELNERRHDGGVLVWIKGRSRVPFPEVTHGQGILEEAGHTINFFFTQHVIQFEIHCHKMQC